MNSDVVEVEVKGTLPTNGGCAVFLGNEEKVFVQCAKHHQNYM